MPEEITLGDLSRAVGEALREARTARGLTLRGVEEASRGRFKPSVVGGYERGERSISLQRFCELANFYRVPADRLLGRVLARLRPSARRELMLDLGRLEAVGEEETARAVGGFVQEVKSERDDPAEDVITLRAGDLEAIALTSGIEVDRLVAVLRPALRSDGKGGPKGPPPGASGRPPAGT